MPLARSRQDKASSAQQNLALQGSAPISDEEREEFVELIEQLHHGKLTSEQQARLGDLIVHAPEPEPQAAAISTTRRVSYQGPLPPLGQLNAYDEETRRIIVQMAVDEQSHTHHMNNKGLDGAIKKDERGQRYGLTTAIVGLIAAAVIAPFSPAAAGVIGTLDLLGMVTVFVAPRILDRRNEASTLHPDQPPDDGS